MSSSIELLEAEALQLPPEQRIRLADHLLASVSGTVDVDEAWAAEIERRIAEVEAGQVSLVPLDIAIKNARQALV